MLRQGFEVYMTGGPDGWSASFFKTRPAGGAVQMVGLAPEATVWRAVQRAAWQTLERTR